eukprot:GHVU01215274.1.p1 GENE.GHVU01215274.1~~GHVU01215274.1.p1  ORF type:complete len:325 (+),score=72.86 GHVU01215274.1:313-1287(+)
MNDGRGSHEVVEQSYDMEGGGDNSLAAAIKPTMYDGVRNPTKAESWMERIQVSLSDRRRETTDTTRLLIIKLFLEGKAKNWFKKMQAAAQFPSVIAFYTEFTKEYIDPTEEDEQALETVQQWAEETVEEYGNRVESMTNNMEVMKQPEGGTLTEAYDIRTRPYLSGLRNPHVREMVIGVAVNKTLAEARELAEEEDRRIKKKLLVTAMIAIKQERPNVILLLEEERRRTAAATASSPVMMDHQTATPEDTGGQRPHGNGFDGGRGRGVKGGPQAAGGWQGGAEGSRGGYNYGGHLQHGGEPWQGPQTGGREGWYPPQGGWRAYI